MIASPINSFIGVLGAEACRARCSRGQTYRFGVLYLFLGVGWGH